MTPTPLVMAKYGFSPGEVSDAIFWHEAGMFLPCLFAGALIDRFGAYRIVRLGMLFLLASAVTVLSGVAAIHFHLSMLLLGVGWSFGFTGATTLLTQACADLGGCRVQGINDTVVALGASVSAFGSGILLSTFGWISVPAVSAPLVLAGLLALKICRGPR